MPAQRHLLYIDISIQFIYLKNFWRLALALKKNFVGAWRWRWRSKKNLLALGAGAAPKKKIAGAVALAPGAGSGAEAWRCARQGTGAKTLA